MIFDLDGTLVDSLPDITRALNLALTEAQRPSLSAEVVRGLVGEGVVRLAEKALLESGVGLARAPQAEVDAVADRIRAIYKAEPCVLTRLFPGVAELLSHVRGTGRHKVALLTNKPGEVTRPLLSALGIAGQLDAVIGDGDGYPRKPDPTAVHALAAQFGTTAARTLMIGDGLPDLDVAVAARCPCAAALWGYTPAAVLRAKRPTHLLEHPREVLELL